MPGLSSQAPFRVPLRPGSKLAVMGGARPVSRRYVARCCCRPRSDVRGCHRDAVRLGRIAGVGGRRRRGSVNRESARAEPSDAFMLELRRRFKPDVEAVSEYLGRDLVTLWGYDRIG
jgi:hypothetical protein